MPESPDRPLDVTWDDLLKAMGVVFSSLGRVLVCLDADFRVVSVSRGLEALAAASETAPPGTPARELLGAELFGESGSMRRALAAGERREGWATTLAFGDGPPRLVSVTGAPIVHRPGIACDPRVAYVVVLRPEEESQVARSVAPTYFAGLVARAPAMLRIFRLIENLSESEATVLVTGESGTGKELIARAVHQHSPRRGGPFVAVNCGALPGELLESELFGHVRGAFTGAYRDRVGRFELAAGGTLFLDEVGELPLPLQVKLLRVLQERTFERVGESVTRTSDARVMAATNQDLRRATLSGDFRDDLYYRLRVVPIEVPPLRSRREDIDPLVHHLLARVGRRHGRSVLLDPAAVRALLRYDWPGNVRELENALEYALAVSRGQTIHERDLPLEVQEAGAGPPPVDERVEPATAAPSERDARDREREHLLATLEAHRWKREPTAAALGISRTTLWRRMRELGLAE